MQTPIEVHVPMQSLHFVTFSLCVLLKNSLNLGEDIFSTVPEGPSSLEF